MRNNATFTVVAFLLLRGFVSIEAGGSPLVDERRSLAGDFNWDITPEDGYPSIAFEDASVSKEAVFKYNFTGTTGPTKFFTVHLLEKYCNGTSDTSSFAFVQNVTGNELEVDLDIIQENISSSKQYTENADGTQAEIDFCIRVDYNYLDATTNETESVNFHETSVSITVDLTANFTLSSISTNRIAATQDEANASLNYPVEAYYCQDDNSEVAGKALTQGNVLQFCVRMYDNVTADVYVEDIMEFTLSQPGGSAANSRPIVNKEADVLTEKLCIEMGICNVKHQLSSKWFSDPYPKPLRIDGVAILSFGKASAMPSSAPGNRRLRVPIRGLLSADEVKAMMGAEVQSEATATLPLPTIHADRKLQAATDSPFDLQVSLLPVDRNNTQKEGDSNMTTYLIIAVCAIALLVGCCILLCVYCINRKNKKKTLVEKQSSFRIQSISREPSFYNPKISGPANTSADSVSHASMYTDNASKFAQPAMPYYQEPYMVPDQEPYTGTPVYLDGASVDNISGMTPRDYLIEDFGEGSAAGLSSAYSDATPWSYSSSSQYRQGEVID